MKQCEKSICAAVTNEKCYYIIKKLKKWVTIKNLEKENYIITDKQAEQLAYIIIQQAESLKVLGKVLKSLRII